jgi:PAS domain S-box-containing protein
MSTPHAPDLAAENAELRARLAEAEETLEAIRTSGVDALVTSGPRGAFLDITERKRTEEALSRSQKTFSELVERSPFGIYVVDAQFRIAQMNAASQTGAFRNVRPVIGRPFTEAMHILWPEPVAAGIIAAFRHTLETGEPYFSPPFVHPRHDVEIVEAYEWQLHRMTLPDGQYGVICYYFDSTPLRQAEREVRKSEQRLNHAQQIANVGSWEWDVQGGALWWSEQVYRQMGEQPGRFTPTYDGFLQHVHPEDRAAFDAAVQRALAETAPYEGEFRIVRPDGSVRVLHSRGEVQPGPDGRPRSMMGVCLDITERKQAERDLFEANQRLQALMHALPVGVSFSDDPTCQRITGNPAALAQFEVAAADNLSASASDAGARGRQLRFFREGQPVTDADLPLQRAVAENREIPPMELEVLLPSGRRWFTQASGAPIRDQQGRVVGGVAVTQDITERKQAEAALARQSEELELILDSAPALIFYKDRENHFLRVNRAFADSMGAPKEQLEGRSLFDLYPREQAEAFWRDDQEVLASGRPKTDIVEPMRTSAGERWVQTGKVPCRDGQGNLTGVIGFALDITERKRAEEALRESEARAKVAEAVQVERQRLAEVLNMLPAYVVLLSPDYHVPFANRFFEERFGKSEGRRCYEYLFNRTEPCEICETFKVLQTNATHRWEWIGPDGHNYDIHDFPFKDVDGSPLIMEVGLDITERKKAEAALAKHRDNLEELVKERTAELRQSERLYRGIGESIDYGVWVCEPDGRNIYASPSFLKLVGITQEQCSNFGWGDVLHPEDAPRTIAAWKECVRTGGTWDIEHRFRGVDGQWHPILARGVPVRDEQGRVIRWAGINLDISRLKHAEAEIRRHAEELRAANSELTRFNEAMVGRELRMLELKQEINALCAQLGQPARYPSALDHAQA